MSVRNMQCCRCCASSQQASLSERSVSRKPGDAAFSLARIGLKGKPPCQHVEDGTSKGFWLPLGQESVGTQRFFSRIGMWLAALESGSVLVVDEIESSMHPLLTRHLIEMVQDAAINTNHAQLIFTTHDTGLLDLTLLRRDQIWFAEKNEKTMQTDIYALTEFSPRKGENIAKGYLQGRYGAIPHMKKELLRSV